MKKNSLIWLAHLGCLLPVGLLVADFTTVNPIQALTQHTGRTALIILLLSLVCTPLTLVGLRQVQPLRKLFGLYGFGYVVVHVAIFIVLDFGLIWPLIWREISEKPYIMAGMAAFALLVPLAITSTKGWQKRLGKRWKLLHRAVYLAVPLAVLHFFWAVKADWREPIIYGLILAGLLALRLAPLRRWLAQLRQATVSVVK